MGFKVARRWAIMLVASTAVALPPLMPPAATAETAVPSECGSFESIAHRGLHPDGVDENSSQALEQGASRGFSLELDVRTDADGVLWVFHDPNTRRATGVDRLLDAMTTHDVRALRYRKAGSPLLTLDEAMDVVARHPETNVYLEPKTVPVASAAADVVIARQRTGNTWLTAKSREVRKAHPEIRQVQKIPVGTRPDASALVEGGFDTVALSTRGITAESVDYYHSAGLVVQARNVASTRQWRHAIAAGVDGQLTDSPLELRQFCPYALRAPGITSANATRRSGRTTVVVNGAAFFDASVVRLGRRQVAFTRSGGSQIVVRTTRRTLEGTRVTVVTPTGSAKRLVRRR